MASLEYKLSRLSVMLTADLDFDLLELSTTHTSRIDDRALEDL